MFGKILHIILALVLLTATTGFSVSDHDCDMQMVQAVESMDTGSCCVEMDMPECCVDSAEYLRFQMDFVCPPVLEREQLPVQDNFLSAVSAFSLHTGEVKTYAVSAVTESPPSAALPARLAMLQTYLI